MKMSMLSLSPVRTMGFAPSSPARHRASSPSPSPSETGQEDAEEPLFYTRRSDFYASAVPFSWEEKPGTPKAGHRPSSSSSSSSSVLAGGSSSFDLRGGGCEFEFSARFSEVPASPTPMLSPSMASSPELFPHAYERIAPLRPPPRLENPVTLTHVRSSSASFSASAPQSPRLPGVLRRALCGVPEVVPDPFSAALEAMHSEEISAKHSGHHRRALSSSPLRMFHWDEALSSKTLSSDAEIALRSCVEQEQEGCHAKTGRPKKLSCKLRNWVQRGLSGHIRRTTGEERSGSSVLVYDSHECGAVSQVEDNPKFRTTSSSCSSSSSSVSSDFSSFAASLRSSSPTPQGVSALPKKSLRSCLKLSFKRNSMAIFSKTL